VLQTQSKFSQRCEATRVQERFPSSHGHTNKRVNKPRIRLSLLIDGTEIAACYQRVNNHRPSSQKRKDLDFIRARPHEAMLWTAPNWGIVRVTL
jgi:hypothetical protein